MREYRRGNKPVIHSTSLWNYNICPKMRILSESNEVELNTAMTEGLILESYVFGAKDKEELKGWELGKLKSLTDARRRTLDKLQEKADLIKPYFTDGEPFKRLEFETEDYILTGEIDYYTDTCLYDLKKTSTIENWKKKTTKWDFLQATYYPYLVFLLTGKILPFKYIVIDDDNLILTVVVKVSSFDWIKSQIEIMTSDLFNSANLDACFNQPYGKCRYIGLCDSVGTELMEINFEALP